MADKVSAQLHPEAIPPMTSTAQEQRPANLAALQQKLQEMAVSTKSVTKERPFAAEGPVIVIRGK